MTVNSHFIIKLICRQNTPLPLSLPRIINLLECICFPYLFQIQRDGHIFVIHAFVQCGTLPPALWTVNDIFDWMPSVGVRIVCITEAAMGLSFTMRMGIYCFAIFFACLLTTSGVHIQFGFRGNVEHLWPQTAASDIFIMLRGGQMSKGWNNKRKKNSYFLVLLWNWFIFSCVDILCIGLQKMRNG